VSKFEYKEEEETEEEETDENDEAIEEAAEKLADRVSTKLNLEEFGKKLGIVTSNKSAKQIYNEIDLEKAADGYYKGDKNATILAFTKALFEWDRPVLKAMSEGVAADGGYLFPDEFRAELIRDLEDLNIMRQLVRVVPMKRDIMKAPKLTSGPKVRWTSENAAKSFNKLLLAVMPIETLRKFGETLLGQYRAKPYMGRCRGLIRSIHLDEGKVRAV